MRIASMAGFALLGFLAAGMLVASAPDAHAERYCAHYHGGGTNCGFHTFEQCRASVHGVGGSCRVNPAYGHHRRHPASS
jgi:hypothetical protein